jgi:anaerobic dimethyl sulfoxide reductase subunit A
MSDYFKAKNESNHGDIIRYTSCGYHCMQTCIIKVHIRDGVVVACEPDDTINPGIAREDGVLSDEAINQGYVQARGCVKGYTQGRILYDPKRLKFPMKRVGKRGEGKFERISWDEALDTIANKLIETKKNYGPYSILHQPYTQLQMCSFPLEPWFGGSFAGWDGHSAGGSINPKEWVMGAPGRENLLLQDEANLFKANLVVMWGRNPVSNLSGGWEFNLSRVKEKGIPIIFIESRYTPSVEFLADQWIPIRPTTDVAMMIAMANVWFKEDLWDKEFARKWIEPEGLQKWTAYVLGTSDGVDKTPQWAESICGVPAETIIDFAHLYIRSKPVNLNVSLTIGRQFYGENPVRASMYLQALSGNIGIPGGTAGAETGLITGKHRGPNPSVDFKRAPPIYQPPIIILQWGWPRAIDRREDLDFGKISKEEYNAIIGNTADNEPPNIQTVILDGCNHLNNMPDINMTIRALKKVDFVMITAQYTEHPAARYADILLPQIYTAYEGRNCWMFSAKDLFRGGVNVSSYFMYIQKCVEPPGEVKSHDWVWTQIAKRLGIAELYNPRLVNVPDDRWDDAIEELHKEAYEKWAKMKEIAPLNPLSWEEFQKKPVFRRKIDPIEYAWRGELASGENPLKLTDSGKMEFYSKDIAKGPQYMAHSQVPPGSGQCFGPGGLPPMAEMTMGGRDNFFGKDADKYPLLMSSPHALYRVHSFLYNEPLLNGDCYRHAVWISVADAKARGIVDNDMVRVYNDIGEMIIPAYVTSRVVPGTAIVFHGGWYTPSKDTTPLMPDGIDKGGAPSTLIHNVDIPETIHGFYPCKGLVQIEKWGNK